MLQSIPLAFTIPILSSKHGCGTGGGAGSGAGVGTGSAGATVALMFALGAAAVGHFDKFKAAGSDALLPTVWKNM